MFLPARASGGAAALLLFLALKVALLLAGTVCLVPGEEAARLVSASAGATRQAQSGQKQRGNSLHEREFSPCSLKIKGEVTNG